MSTTTLQPCDASRCTHPGRYGLYVVTNIPTSTLAAVDTEPYTAACGRHLATAVIAATGKGRTVAVADLTTAGAR